MKTPIEQMLDQVEWRDIDTPDQLHVDDLYATHEGIWEFGAMELRVYRLNNGQTIINSDDFLRFFNLANGEAKE